MAAIIRGGTAEEFKAVRWAYSFDLFMEGRLTGEVRDRGLQKPYDAIWSGLTIDLDKERYRHGTKTVSGA